MCGIVGVVGNPNATDILLQGLEKLEYRGYDSAGVYLTSDNDQQVIKAVGRIQNLVDKANQVAATSGIGHTRWATHGKATETNAHPHTSQSGRFKLVHNGVVENFAELKRDYLVDDQFYGETDTEIAVHLVEYFAKKEQLETYEAFERALSVIEGSYAFALMDTELSDTIYIAKNKSPMLIALGDGYNMVASDAMAMIRETDQFLEIHDGEIGTITPSSVTIYSSDNRQIVERSPFTAEIDLSDIDKGTYPHYMIKEIDEQPGVMRQLAATYTDDAGQVTIDDAIIDEVIKADRIYMIAAGTSYHSGYAAKRFFESLTHKPVEMGIASEWGYHMPLLSEKPLFIYLTQSGETADSRQVLVETNRLGYPAITITNVPGSTLSREAKHTLLLHAGPEIAVASTKAYTAQIATLALLAKAVGDRLGYEQALAFDIKKELALVAQAIEGVLDEKASIKDKTEKLLENTRTAFYIGRGNDYYVAMEAALKLKEISYIQTEGYAGGELKHGTISLIEEGTPVIGLLSDELASHTRSNLIEVASRGAKVMTVAMANQARDSDDIIVPTSHAYLTSIVVVVATQLIAYYETLHRHLDVDKPRNLAKAVTVE